MKKLIIKLLMILFPIIAIGQDNKIRFRAYDIDFIGVDAAPTRTSMEASLIKKNGKLRTGDLYITMKSDAEKELSRIFQSLVNSLENKTETDDDW